VLLNTPVGLLGSQSSHYRKEIKMVEKKTQTITIDGVDYTEDQLTDQQKAMVNHINDLNRKINSTQFNLDQLNVGKNAFVNMLTQSLKEPLEVAAE
jgi:hypothetical protein